MTLRLDPGEGRIRTARSFRAWEGGGSRTGSTRITICLASGKTKKIKVKVQKSAVAAKKICGVPATLTVSKGGKTKTLEPVVYPVTCVQKITYKFSSGHHFVF